MMMKMNEITVECPICKDIITKLDDIIVRVIRKDNTCDIIFGECLFDEDEEPDTIDKIVEWKHIRNGFHEWIEVNLLLDEFLKYIHYNGE